MIPIRLGIELEFIGPDTDFMSLLFFQKFKRNLGYESSMRGWSYDEDCSAGNFGMEIRTPAFKSLREVAQLRRPLSVIRHFCWLTNHCGMHVHLSAPRRMRLDLAPFADAIWRRYGRQIACGRRQYCRKGFFDEYEVQDTGDRWRSVVQVNKNHVEVRVFNGTLDYETVYRRVSEVAAIYRHFLFLPLNLS